MRIHHRFLVSLLGAMILFALIVSPVLAQDGGDSERPTGWADDSHGNDVDPDYSIVFPQDAVNTVTITVSPDNWQMALDDMTDLYGEFGAGGGMMGGRPPMGERPEGGNPGQPPDSVAPGQMPEGFDPGQMPGVMPPGGGNMGTDQNSIWIPVDIQFQDQTWTNVGFRFKGNSSLMSTWGAGVWKLPFKLDFDEFEDDYPEIDNQRFFGFKQLSFSSNWSDASLLREKVTADVFRDAGVPSAETAFYAIYVDFGEGPLYFGLYTAVEIVDDTVIQTQFADDDGNVYKPEGSGATFAEGSFNEASFDKETNKNEDDYSDILALFDALHAETRLTDPETWRNDLEAVFNVDGFLRWLAVNTVVQNWDTYGQMSHNYYLYTDPTTNQINWIPWDNNMALRDGMGVGPGAGAPAGNPGGRGSQGGLSLDLDDVTTGWPLIRYLIDDPIYHEVYVAYVEETINSVFEPQKMTATYQMYHELIAPYVVGDNGEQSGYTNLNSPDEFETALSVLIEHVNARYEAAQEYINTQTAAQ